MAIALRGSSGGAGAASSFVVPAAAGAPVADDYRIVMVNVQDNTFTTTPPAGWTALGTAVKQHMMFGRKFVAGDTDATFTFSAAATYAWGVFAFSGVDTTTPTDTTPAAIAASLVAPDQTTATADTLLICGWGALCSASAQTQTVTAPATMTGLIKYAGTGVQQIIGMAYEARPTPGATGTRTGAISGTNANVGSGSVTLRSAAANLAPPGIASGEAFGTAAVNLQLDAPGIASAEAFGAPAVNLQLDAPGIASDEAFGATRVDNETISPVGIPSAEAFGPVEVRNYGLAPVGIPSAEAFGAVTLTATYTIPATGIPSGEAFGTTTLVLHVHGVGGIPSGEAFGATEAIVKLRGKPRPAVAHPAPVYELVCVARVPQTSSPPLLLEVDPIDWTGLSYTDELSRPQRLDAGCQVSALTEAVLQRLRNLDELATELWLYRNGRLIFSGPLLGWQVQGEALTLQALGLLAYLRYWYVTSDLLFKQADQHMIVKSLVDHWQNLEYGHYGIDTSDIAASGQLRDATYLMKEEHNIGQRVEELGRRQSGFDIEVDPASRDLKLWTPQQGVDRSTGEDAIIFDLRNVTSGNVLCSAAPGDVASEVFGTGTTPGGTLYSAKSNTSLRSSFGRTGYAANFDGVSEQSTLDAHTQAALDARSETLLVPGPDVRTTADADLAAYDVGDVVAYQLHERLGVAGSFRIRKRQVTVSKTGREKTAVEFV